MCFLIIRSKMVKMIQLFNLTKWKRKHFDERLLEASGENQLQSTIAATYKCNKAQR